MSSVPTSVDRGQISRLESRTLQRQAWLHQQQTGWSPVVLMEQFTIQDNARRKSSSLKLSPVLWRMLYKTTVVPAEAAKDAPMALVLLTDERRWRKDMMSWIKKVKRKGKTERIEGDDCGCVGVWVARLCICFYFFFMVLLERCPVSGKQTAQSRVAACQSVDVSTRPVPLSACSL